VYLAIKNEQRYEVRQNARNALNSEIAALEKSLNDATTKLKRLQPEDEESKTDLLSLD